MRIRILTAAAALIGALSPSLVLADACDNVPKDQYTIEFPGQGLFAKRTYLVKLDLAGEPNDVSIFSSHGWNATLRFDRHSATFTDVLGSSPVSFRTDDQYYGIRHVSAALDWLATTRSRMKHDERGFRAIECARERLNRIHVALTTRNLDLLNATPATGATKLVSERKATEARSVAVGVPIPPTDQAKRTAARGK